MNKEETTFDPSGVGIHNGQYFGFPYQEEESNVILYSIPWDATTSYGGGASQGPNSILEASVQLDFFDFDIANAWAIKRYTHPISDEIKERSEKARKKAKKVIDHLEANGDINDQKVQKWIKKVNRESEWLSQLVEEKCTNLLNANKKIGLIGGDHSTPLGYLKALAKHHHSFGILQIDAHADLREAYEGFEQSHASIMYNALQIPQIASITQVGIRDLSPDEWSKTQSDSRLHLFSDAHLQQQHLNGKPWGLICDEIIHSLPQKVYISFDIDGLSPDLCPNTGTPVLGGFSIHQIYILLKKIQSSGKELIGFDLCEVSPEEKGEWNANVGARILYKLSNYLGE